MCQGSIRPIVHPNGESKRGSFGCARSLTTVRQPACSTRQDWRSGIVKESIVTKFEATPTEYRGVTYRSKCEAMFARYLVLNGDDDEPRFKAFGFEYEPDGFEVNGWKLDFLTWWVGVSVNVISKHKIPTMFYGWIEYKPSMPTKSYCKKLSKNFIKLASEMEYYDGLVIRSGFSLYYGSVFTSERGIVNFDRSGNIFFDKEDDWLVNYEDDVRSTRFDLENAD